MAKATSNFFSAGEITAMIARTNAGEACPTDEANLIQVAEKWSADRTAKALVEWSGYAVAGHDGGANGLISALHIALDTPARLNPATGEMESQQYNLVSDTSSGTYSCDCEDYHSRIAPLNQALYRIDAQTFIPLECKHGRMVDQLLSRELAEEKAQADIDSARRELAELEAAAARLRAQLGIEPDAALPDVAAQLEEANRSARVFQGITVSQQQKLDDLRAELAIERRSSQWWEADNERLKIANDRLAAQISTLKDREAIGFRRYQSLTPDQQRAWRRA